MQENIRIRNEAGICSIDIEGTIGIPETWQFDDPAQRVATYDAFRAALRRLGEVDAAHILVNIRSTGGDVNDALLIYEALVSLGAHITTRCYGYTASAATLIAQAASEGCREVSANALYLIHTATCATEGNAAELTARLELLRQTDERLAALYAARSGRPAAEFAALMSENNGCGRWLTPAETIAAGLADTVLEAPLIRNPHNSVRHRAPVPAPEEDHSILHFDDIPPRERSSSLIAARQGQQGVLPTTTQPCEDPSVHELLQSPNQRAYADDARRFCDF